MKAIPVLDELTHVYHIDGKPLTSVTNIIREVWPVTPAHEQAPLSVLENARVRGERVDYWTGRYAETDGEIDIEDKDDVVQRMDIFHDWWQIEKPHFIGQQVTVWNDHACGRLDLLLKWKGCKSLIDVKCTYEPQQTWPLQVGGYSDLLDDGEPVKRIGTLHINPRFEVGKKYQGVRCNQPGIVWRAYEVSKAQQWWRNTLAFWLTVQEISQ